ncbi:MAG: hypothetical protein L0H15_07150 [Nitrosospira sp.]|nr:hypothetical protein [Nitrosospira sp.]
MPCSPIPADRNNLACNGHHAAAFRRLDNVGSRDTVMSGLNHTACTLARSGVAALVTQYTAGNSLPAVGYTLPGRVGYLPDSERYFRLSTSLS